LVLRRAIELDEYPLKEEDLCVTLCDGHPYFYTGIPYTDCFHHIYNQKKRHVELYYQYVLYKGKYIKKYNLHLSKNRYIYNEYIIYKYQDSNFSLKDIPIFKIDNDYFLAPVIIDTRNSKCIAILKLFDSLPAEIVNVIYQMCGGIRKFVPAPHVLDYTDFSGEYISSIPELSTHPLIKSELKTLYDANKLILHQRNSNGISSIALTEEAYYLYMFSNDIYTRSIITYRSMDEMIETRDEIVNKFFSESFVDFF
jgi:hypothetical protein